MKVIVLLLSVVFLGFGVPVRCTPAAAGTVGLVAGGDFATVDRLLERNNAVAALQCLDAAGPHDFVAAVLWRRARARYQLGLAADSADGRKEQFRRAEERARQAIAANPDDDEGYKWLAVALGARAGEDGPAAGVGRAGEIREVIDRALVIDPDDDISLLVLGLWHYRIASRNPLVRSFVRLAGGLPPASLDDAEYLLRQAIAIHDRIIHRYYLGRVYYALGDRPAAIKQLERALELPVSFPDEGRKLDRIRRKLSRWRAERRVAEGAVAADEVAVAVESGSPVSSGDAAARVAR
ncbi:MAG: tetratricopeptide repeat protein [Deltaproteobacteria bacterium]|nr:tetratricopeptide repeat protein [Candidatus Anaeroferrophillacea bacterium]